MAHPGAAERHCFERAQGVAHLRSFARGSDRRGDLFPNRGKPVPLGSDAAAALPKGATCGCGELRMGRISDVSVGGAAPDRGTPHEAAGSAQVARAGGVTRWHDGGTHRAEERSSPVPRAEPERSVVLAWRAARILLLTARAPGVLSPSPKRIMKSDTCEPRGRPDGLGWTVHASLSYTHALGGPAAAGAASARAWSLASSLFPRCATPAGGRPVRVRDPRDAAWCGAQAVPGGGSDRGTHLAGSLLEVVPPFFGLRRMSEERVQ